MASTPAAPAKKSSLPLIIALIVAAIPSLCCCLVGILIMLPGTRRTWNVNSFMGNQAGTFPDWIGFVCVGAALIPWIFPLVVAIARRK